MLVLMASLYAPHVHAGQVPRETHRRPAGLQLRPPAGQHERRRHPTILLGIFIVCWAPFFPPPGPDDLLPQEPLLRLFHVPLQHVPDPHHVQLRCRPLIYAFRSQEMRETFRELLCC
ncbi:hypothetical protein DPEC_G00362200 [Dallia pectoralis]|nr:hypothetical protein DPEC_G00362200 [Dallia pectoralis]